MSRAVRIAAILALCLPLLAWDTRTTQRIAWHSPYVTDSGGTGVPNRPGVTRNAVREHTLISHLALEELGVADLFGAGGEAALSVVDLNASYFRDGDLLGVHPRGDNVDTLLEERRIAAPANMVGLADYSYSVLDWLNKTAYCPAARDAPDLYRCHEFKGWLGALNSVHFGSQATAMYARYHRIAMELATRGREMRERMTEEEQELHRQVLLEAEVQALTYEAFAQHFLQDRWSMGHMFERWNGGDANQAAYSLEDGSSAARQLLAVGQNLLVAGMAGAIHGWEGITRDIDAMHAISSTGDPMSSPYIDGDTLILSQYRHASMGDNSPVVNGVGDERFADMLSGGFGAGYGDLTANIPMDVSNQRDGMMACSMAGWADVIREFGDTGGSYGAHGALLPADAPAFDPLARETCWDMWATNQSMWLGFYGQDTRALATLSAIVAESAIRHTAVSLEAVGDALSGEVPSLPMPRSELVGLGWHIWRRSLEDPNGTDLAQGGIGELWGVQPGNAYGLPNFAEPVALDQMPDIDPRGIDRRALYGAFSRAHSDHWCEEREDFLNEVRAPVLRSAEPRMDQQICQYVASMAYQGTHPLQISRHARTLRTESGAEARSMCAIRSTDTREDRFADNPDDPFYIDIGYVDWRNAPPHPQHVMGAAEIAEWCARTPVLRAVRHDGDTELHLVAHVEPGDTEVEIDAFDLGDRPGRIMVENELTGDRFEADVSQWQDDSLTLAQGGGLLFDADQQYRLEVETADGRTSVGLFRLHVMELPELTFVQTDLGGRTPCGIEPPDFDIYNLAEMLPDTITGPVTPAVITEIRDTYATMADELDPYLESEASCIRQLASTRGATVLAWLNRPEPPRDPEQEVFSPCCTPFAVPFIDMILHPDHPDGIIGDFYLAYADEVDDIREDLAHNVRVLDFWLDVLTDEETTWTLPTTAAELIAERDAELASANPDYERARLLNEQATATLRLDPELSNEAWLEQYFIDADEHPVRSELPHAGAHLMGWAAIGPALRVDGDILNERIMATLEGLPAWAQVEHTTINHIIPGWVSGPRGETTAGWARRFSLPWNTQRRTSGRQTADRETLMWPNSEARLAAASRGYEPGNNAGAGEATSETASADNMQAAFGPRTLPDPPELRIPTYNYDPGEGYELPDPLSSGADDTSEGASARPTKPDPEDDNNEP